MINTLTPHTSHAIITRPQKSKNEDSFSDFCLAGIFVSANDVISVLCKIRASASTQKIMFYLA